MVQLKQKFKANEHSPSQPGGYDLLPEDDYEVCITSSESAIGKSSGKEYAKLTVQVLEGDYKNRLVWHNLILESGTIEGQKKVDGIITSLCNACGVDEFEDTADLHDIPFIAHIKIDQAEPGSGFNDSNKISSFKQKGKTTKKAPEIAKNIAKKLGAAPTTVSASQAGAVSFEDDQVPDFLKN